MKKSTLNKMRARLDKAIEPPRQLPAKDDNSDSIAQRYAVPDTRPARPASLEKSASHAEFASLEKSASPEDSASLAIIDSPVRKSASQANSASLANPAARLATPTPDILASLPDVKGYLRLYYQLIDHLLPQLMPAEAIVYLHLYRLSWGFGNPTCTISNPGLARRSKMSTRSAQEMVARLQSKRLIEKVGQIIGAGKEQGIEWRVAIPASLEKSASHAESARLEKSATNKVNTQKENTQTQEPAAAVRVGSKFSIEECRSYAEHLRSTGQGINNPGGYATTIHRTGEADALIEAFLNPAPTPTQVDASQCPDCQGTGFYYPKGIEQGVAKCPHARLSVSQQDEQTAT